MNKDFSKVINAGICNKLEITEGDNKVRGIVRKMSRTHWSCNINLKLTK